MNGRILGRLCLMSAILLSAWRIGLCADEPKSVPPATQPTPQVVALVQKLGGDSFKEREAAQAELIGMAAAAEPSLRALLQTDLNAEAKARVEATLAKIAENRLIGGSLITLHYTDAPLQTIMDDFTKQAGAKMGTDRKEIVDLLQNKKMTINLDHGSFWEALHLICQSAGLTPVTQPYYQGTGKMMLEIPGHAGPRPYMVSQPVDLPTDAAVVAGPFIVVPQSCTLTRMIQYEKDANGGGAAAGPAKVPVGPGPAGHGGVAGNGDAQAWLSLVCACEPKLLVMGGLNSDCVKQVIDDKGRDLLVDTGHDTPAYNRPRGWCLPLSVGLKDFPDRAKKIATIKGVVKADVCTKFGTFVVEDVMKAGVTMKQVGAMTITFTGVTTQALGLGNTMTTLNISVIAPETNNLNTQNISRDIEVTDANGNALQVNNGGMASNAGGHMDLKLNVNSMNGQPAPAPKKLVWEIPIESRPVEMPFELHDLPLPQ